MKQRNPTWGCPRIAQQITLAFGIPINKDVVRRILAARYQPTPDSAGPSWLTVLGHAKDSLWSLDLFRCESAVLRTHWVLVVMDQCTRRIVGFGVHRGVVDGVALCRMFNRATRGQPAPTYLSSDHDPLYRFHQWQANLRILDVKEIKTVPYVPLSHPFVERLIGTIRRECLDRTLFWTAADLEMKLLDFQRYYNGHRTHAGLDGRTPEPSTDRGRRPRECQCVSLAAALSWAVSDADGGVRYRNSPWTGNEEGVEHWTDNALRRVRRATQAYSGCADVPRTRVHRRRGARVKSSAWASRNASMAIRRRGVCTTSHSSRPSAQPSSKTVVRRTSRHRPSSRN